MFHRTTRRNRNGEFVTRLRQLSGWLCCLAAGSVLLALAGCGAQAPAQNSRPALDLAELRQQILLADEPNDGLGVIDALESTSSGQQVVIVGRIAGGKDAWDEDTAAFRLVDLSSDVTIDDHAHHHHEPGDSCQFCQRKSEEAAEKLAWELAWIRCVDAAGQVIPTDARQLLEIESGDIVVVRGVVERKKLHQRELFVVLADGLYVRR